MVVLRRSHKVLQVTVVAQLASTRASFCGPSLSSKLRSAKETGRTLGRTRASLGPLGLLVLQQLLVSLQARSAEPKPVRKPRMKSSS